MKISERGPYFRTRVFTPIKFPYICTKEVIIVNWRQIESAFPLHNTLCTPLNKIMTPSKRSNVKPSKVVKNMKFFVTRITLVSHHSNIRECLIGSSCYIIPIGINIFSHNRRSPTRKRIYLNNRASKNIKSSRISRKIRLYNSSSGSTISSKFDEWCCHKRTIKKLRNTNPRVYLYVVRSLCVIQIHNASLKIPRVLLELKLLSFCNWSSNINHITFSLRCRFGESNRTSSKRRCQLSSSPESPVVLRNDICIRSIIPVNSL